MIRLYIQFYGEVLGSVDDRKFLDKPAGSHQVGPPFVFKGQFELPFEQKEIEKIIFCCDITRGVVVVGVAESAFAYSVDVVDSSRLISGVLEGFGL